MDVVASDLVSRTCRPDGTPIVRGARLIAPSGRLTVLVGPSGTGKSTLLDLVAGLERPTSGTVRVGPHVVHPASQASRTRLRARVIATARQDGDLIDDLTATDNIELGQRLSHRRNRVFADRVAAAIGLDGALLGRSAGALSGGERRRVSIARAVASGTPCLALDEPTSALDEASAAHVRLLLRHSADAGRTVLAVTHDVTLAGQADFVVTVVDGVITAVAPRPTQTEVRRLMGVH